MQSLYIMTTPQIVPFHMWIQRGEFVETLRKKEFLYFVTYKTRICAQILSIILNFQRYSPIALFIIILTMFLNWERSSEFQGGHVSPPCFAAVFRRHVSPPCFAAMFRRRVSPPCFAAMFRRHVSPHVLPPCFTAMFRRHVSTPCFATVFAAMFRRHVSPPRFAAIFRHHVSPPCFAAMFRIHAWTTLNSRALSFIKWSFVFLGPPSSGHFTQSIIWFTLAQFYSGLPPSCQINFIVTWFNEMMTSAGFTRRYRQIKKNNISVHVSAHSPPRVLPWNAPCMHACMLLASAFVCIMILYARIPTCNNAHHAHRP